MSIIYYTTLPAFGKYFQPKTIHEVLSLLASHGKEAKILAGGTDLLFLMGIRVLTPKCIVDITRISGLDYIKYNREGLKIGALATISVLERSAVVKEHYPLLHEATCLMATTQVKNMGTVAGNLCRASPAADTAPPLLALKAKVKIVGTAGSKIVPLEEFFTGPGQTVLQPTEILREIQVPRLPPNTGTAFLRITRVAADLAKVNVATVLRLRDGVCQDARIVLGAVAPTPLRAKKAERVLIGNKVEDKTLEEAATVAIEEIRPLTDVRSAAEYRKEVSKVLVRRALRLAWERAGGQAK